MTIYFYGSKEKPYGCFSNFSSHGFEFQGVWWHTSEHFFQAQKFAGTPYAEQIRQAPTASLAAKMGRRRSHPLRSDWEQVKVTLTSHIMIGFPSSSPIFLFQKNC